MNIGFDGKRAFHNFRGLGNYSRNLIQGLIQYYPEHCYTAFTPEFSDTRANQWQENVPELNIVSPDGLINTKLPSIWRSQFMIKSLQRESIQLYHAVSAGLLYC